MSPRSTCCEVFMFYFWNGMSGMMVKFCFWSPHLLCGLYAHASLYANEIYRYHVYVFTVNVCKTSWVDSWQSNSKPIRSVQMRWQWMFTFRVSIWIVLVSESFSGFNHNRNVWFKIQQKAVFGFGNGPHRPDTGRSWNRTCSHGSKGAFSANCFVWFLIRFVKDSIIQ